MDLYILNIRNTVTYYRFANIKTYLWMDIFSQKYITKRVSVLMYTGPFSVYFNKGMRGQSNNCHGKLGNR